MGNDPSQIFRTQRRFNRQTRPQDSNDFFQRIVQFLPLIFIVLFSLLSSWFSSDTNFLNHVSFQSSSNFRYSRSTIRRNVSYFADSTFHNHFYNFDRSYKLKKELSGIEDVIEQSYLQNLQTLCNDEKRKLQKEISAASKKGNDEELNNLKAKSLPNCEKLSLFGDK